MCFSRGETRRLLSWRRPPSEATSCVDQIWLAATTSFSSVRARAQRITTRRVLALTGVGNLNTTPSDAVEDALLSAGVAWSRRVAVFTEPSLGHPGALTRLG
jgi:hypothetical protein